MTNKRFVRLPARAANGHAAATPRKHIGLTGISQPLFPGRSHKSRFADKRCVWLREPIDHLVGVASTFAAQATWLEAILFAIAEGPCPSAGSYHPSKAAARMSVQENWQS